MEENNMIILRHGLYYYELSLSDCHRQNAL